MSLGACPEKGIPRFAQDDDATLRDDKAGSRLNDGERGMTRGPSCCYVPAVTPEELAEALARALPAETILRDAEALDAHAHDETEDLRSRPGVVVAPRTETEVRALMSAARERRFPVTPQGARTGLSGGALPSAGGVALDLTRMNRILEIDRESLYAVVEPGVVTQALQEEAERVGLFYPPDPSSRGSCTLGGNIAENAGGPRAAKYGTTGRYVSGLRVVVPGGAVLALGGKNRKDVAGYDLRLALRGQRGNARRDHAGDPAPASAAHAPPAALGLLRPRVGGAVGRDPSLRGGTRALGLRVPRAQGGRGVRGVARHGASGRGRRPALRRGGWIRGGDRRDATPSGSER